MVRGPADHLSFYFDDLPHLTHLSVMCGRYDVEHDEKYDGYKSIGYTPSPFDGYISRSHLPWPILPELLTVTIDHFDVSKILPMCMTSPKIRRMHLHGEDGFNTILSFLLADPSLNSINGIFDDDHLPLPELDLLRLWPSVMGPYLGRRTSQRVPEVANAPALLDNLLKARRGLHVEIGTVQMPPTIKTNFWRGAWNRSKFSVLEKDYDERLDVWDEYDRENDWYAISRLGYIPLPDTFKSSSDEYAACKPCAHDFRPQFPSHIFMNLVHRAREADVEEDA